MISKGSIKLTILSLARRVYAREIEMPPSTENAVPVTKLEASEAGNSAARAISAGIAMRLSA